MRAVSALNESRIVLGNHVRLSSPQRRQPASSHAMLKLMENARVFTADGNAAAVRALSFILNAENVTL